MNYIVEDFQKIIDRLDEVLNLEKTTVNRDSAIKRFEMCFDLSWKAVKTFAKKQGVECTSPRRCFKEAFQMNLISDMEKWISILEDRNLTAHLYNEAHADEVYERLKEYLQLFKELLKKLKI